MNPSKTVELILEKIVETNSGDLLLICTEIDDLIIQKLAKLLLNPNLKFKDKFQLIADLTYCAEFLEDLLQEAQTFVDLMTDDPYYLLIELLEDEDE